MTDPDGALKATLAALRREYVAEAPRRLAELRAGLQVAGSGDRAALERVQSQLHKLAGSGGGYGLPAVSESARAGELAARAVLESGEPINAGALAPLRVALDRLAAAFDHARSLE